MQHTSREPCLPLVAPGAIDHHVADLTVTASADVTLGALQAQLRRAGQWLPIDGDPRRTLGELVLANSTGPLRLGYGAWRDVLLGAQIIDGRGQRITVGGRVLKNVAGYDLIKFFIGSYGCFGRCETLTVRTWKSAPAALHVAHLLRAFDVAAAIRSPLRPRWIVRTSDAITCGYHGDDTSLPLFRKDAENNRATTIVETTIDGDITRRDNLWAGRRWRIVVPPARLTEFLASLALTNSSADPTFGVIVADDVPADPFRIHALARSAGGCAIEFGGSGGVIRVSMTPSAYAMLRKLKHAFDPDAVLAPLPENVE